MPLHMCYIYTLSEGAFGRLQDGIMKDAYEHMLFPKKGPPPSSDESSTNVIAAEDGLLALSTLFS